MKDGTNKLLKSYYFIVDQIVSRFGEDKRRDKLRLHIAFKAFYRREYGVSHTSLKDFQRSELTELINRILIEFSVEYGVYLLQPNDPENAEDISLFEYFVYKSWIVNNDDLSYLEAVKTLPEGYVLIESLEQLKRLKTIVKYPNTKRPKKIKVLEFYFGIHLYQYSPTKKIYYKRFFTEITPMEKVEEYINRGILYGP